MEQPSPHLPDVLGSSRRVVERVLEMGETRLQLLALEVQEARQRFLHLLLCAFGTAVLGLLAGIALTFWIVLRLWDYFPLAPLGILAGFYSLTAYLLYRKLKRLQFDWPNHSTTLDQLRKDREWLTNALR